MSRVTVCSACGGSYASEAGGSAVCVACAFALAIDLDDRTPTPRPDSDGPEAAGTAAELGEKVGPYRLLRVIGDGGMGHVYEATQDEPVRRRVALKRIKLGMDSAQVLRRFESERQALALMSHPNIARVYDAGSSPDGRPYFAMELIEGPWITRYCDEHRLGVRERLELFLDVCRGIEHAHQKGVIHRDIKPSNVLVQTEEGRPVPKVINFGVAKAVGARLGERTDVTRVGQFVGTPEYMSPEQAGTASFDVDTRTDVYSLGVLLYELFTGHLPFEGARADDVELRRRVLEDDAPTPSSRVESLGESAPRSLARQLRGDLDWIVKKALEKDRARRYGSPSELAADLLRHMENEPVLAGPPSVAYRAGKFCRRHRVGVTAAAVGIVGILAFGVVMAAQARRIAAEREASDKTAQFLANMLGTASPQAMGAALWKDLRVRVSDATKRRGATTQQTGATLAALDEALAGVNATDTALHLLDEQVLARAGATIEQEMAGQPRIAGGLEFTLADTYVKLGLYPQAEQHAKRCLEIRRALLGAEHPDTLKAMSALGSVYASAGRYAEAETMHRDTLAIRRRVLGPDDPDTLMSMHNLADALRRQNKLKEAEALHRETLEARRRVLGPEHVDTLKSMGSLGLVLDREERYADAEELFRPALETTRTVLGPENRETISCMNNLGNIYMRMKRNAEAETLLRGAVEISTRVNGQDHPNTASYMNNLANVLLADGRLDEAEALLRQTLAIRRRILAPDHPYTCSSLHNLANACKDQGRLEEAAALYREAVESRRRSLPPDHPDTVDDIYAIGSIAALRGDRAEALRWLTEAVDHGYKGHNDLNPMEGDDDLKSLRGDPAFEALAARVRERSKPKAN